MLGKFAIAATMILVGIVLALEAAMGAPDLKHALGGLVPIRAVPGFSGIIAVILIVIALLILVPKHIKTTGD